MVIKVSWTQHDRTYTIGVRQFLDNLGVECSDEDIENAVKKLLSEQ